MNAKKIDRILQSPVAGFGLGTLLTGPIALIPSVDIIPLWYYLAGGGAIALPIYVIYQMIYKNGYCDAF